MDKDQLIAELRARLSWAYAKPAENAAFQAYLEMQRDRDPTFINKLGIYHEDIRHLFEE